MEISLQNIVPKPLSTFVDESAIWGESITFLPNKHYSIVAPSGKGKSTFVHVVYGLRKDYTGNLFWGEKKFSVLDWNEVQEIRKEQFGIIFQDLRLFLKLNPWENIAAYSMGEEISKPQILSMAEALEIDALLDTPCHKLSQGQLQRVAILRALSRPFNWLIMDEPFSHLDEAIENQAMALINEVVSKNGASMIYLGLDKIPHDLPMADELVL